MPPKDFLGQAAGRPRREIPVCHHRLSPRSASAVRAKGSRCRGFGASPSDRVRAAGCAAVRSAGSPRPGGANLRSSRDPSQRTTAHKAWKPTCGRAPSRVNLSAVSCMGYRERLRRVEEPMGLGRLHAQDLKRCRLMSRFAALVFNWWTLFVRLADPHHHRETTTSRPLLLSALGRRATHAGRTTIRIASTHAGLGARGSDPHRGIPRKLRSSAEQLTPLERWHRILSIPGARRKRLLQTVLGTADRVA